MSTQRPFMMYETAPARWLQSIQFWWPVCRAEGIGEKQAQAARSRSIPVHPISRSLTESNSQPGVETGIGQEKSRPVAAFSFQIHNLQKIVGGVDGTRTRDPRRDRPVLTN